MSAHGKHFLLCGKIEEISPLLFADNSFDACFCDPPYLLEFMGREFDRQHKKEMGNNDGQRMQRWHERWAKEVYRVLKPGGYILAFGGTRTVHRLASALEDVGFEINTQLAWLFGQGFPKSHDISKGIDKLLGAERKIIGPKRTPDGQSYLDRSPRNKDSQGWDRPWKNNTEHRTRQQMLTAPATEEAERWQGYGSQIKPAMEPLVLAMKPLDGTYTQNALKWGVGGLNIDACRITDKWEGSDHDSGPSVSLRGGADGSLNNQRSGSHPSGRWPANLLLSHHPSCTYKGKDGLEEVEVWECHPDCPVRMLDEQSGHSKSGVQRRPNPRAGGIWKTTKGSAPEGPQYGDTGGASRFFARFSADRYCLSCGSDLESPIMRGCHVKNAVHPSAKESVFALSDAQRSPRPDSVDRSEKSLSSAGLAEPNSAPSLGTIPNTAPRGVHPKHSEQSDPDALSAESLCEKCTTAIVPVLAALPSLPSEESLVGLASTIGLSRPILSLSLVLAVERLESTGITTIIRTLRLWSGCVRAATAAITILENEGQSYASDRRNHQNCPSRFGYSPKVSPAERDLGLPKGTNRHSTLKPISLCRYLSTLLLPPPRDPSSPFGPRKLLVPFSATGSEIAGALLAGWDEVWGVEMDAEWVEVAEKRIPAALQAKGKETIP